MFNSVIHRIILNKHTPCQIKRWSNIIIRRKSYFVLRFFVISLKLNLPNSCPLGFYIVPLKREEIYCTFRRLVKFILSSCRIKSALAINIFTNTCRFCRICLDILHEMHYYKYTIYVDAFRVRHSQKQCLVSIHFSNFLLFMAFLPFSPDVRRT